MSSVRVDVWVLVAVIAGLLSGSGSAQDAPQFGTVSGTVRLRERIALPNGAEVVVQLADISFPENPAVVIAQQSIFANGRQLPLAFALTYERASLTAGHMYGVYAKIRVDSDIRWRDDHVYEVISNGADRADILLLPVESISANAEPISFGRVSGTVSYLPKIALPDDAVVLVELSDVTHLDKPAFVLASQQFVAGGRQVPLPFSLTYVSSGLKPNGWFTISAKILVDGDLRWASTMPYSVISNGMFNVDIEVEQVAR